MDFSTIFKWAGTLLPLLAQGVLQIQSNAGVNHSTIVGNIAAWIIAATASKAFHAAHDDQSSNPGT